jgi:hypothetical protein
MAESNQAERPNDLGKSNLRALPHHEINRLGIRQEPTSPCDEASGQGQVQSTRQKSRGEVCGWPRIDYDVATSNETRQLLGVQMRRGLEPIQDGRPRLVHPRHRGEVRWRIGLARQHAGDEVVLVRRFERPIEPPLVAQCTERHRADALTAR